MKPIAVLTGGSRGIGAEILARLLGADHDVLVIGLSPPVGPVDGRVVFSHCDLAAGEGVRAAATAIEVYLHARGRPADVFIHNAGGALPRPIDDLQADEIQHDITLNLIAAILLARAIVPGMRAAGRGRIVNIASTAGRAGVPYLHSYSAAKAGLIAFTQSLAAETASHGVRVNCVCPGGVETESARTGRDALSALHGLPTGEYEQRLARATGLSRLLHPSEVAEVVLWLASSSAAGVTGQTVNVCGVLEMG